MIGGPTTKLREPVPPGRGWQSQRCPVLILRRISLSAAGHCIVPITTHHCSHNPAPISSWEETSVSRTAFTYKACYSKGSLEYQLCITNWAKTPKVSDLIAYPTPTPPHVVQHVFGIILESRPSSFRFAVKKLFEQ